MVCLFSLNSVFLFYVPIFDTFVFFSKDIVYLWIVSWRLSWPKYLAPYENTLGDIEFV